MSTDDVDRLLHERFRRWHGVPFGGAQTVDIARDLAAALIEAGEPADEARFIVMVWMLGEGLHSVSQLWSDR